MLLDTPQVQAQVHARPRPTGPRESAYRIGAMVRHNIRIRLRDPGQMISYIAMPMVLMIVLKPLYVRAVEGGATQVVTGLLVMFSVFAIAIAGSSIMVERQWQTWDRLRASNASATEMLLGKVIPIFVVMVAQQSILLTYGCLVIGLPMPPSLGYLALAILVWAFALLAIGAALATIARSLGELGVISDVGALVLSSMGGALVPLSIMPGWAQAAAHASPGYWALSLMQAAVRGDGAAMVLPTVILLALGVLAGTFAVRRLTRGWGRTRLL
ncbi:ABC transporter permease [Actinokineospora xionganensis]|uniref:Transport permease protein n=1 Tax=Actinokineospora xionganensis TaxID=2684470 RepID=A0ABR7L4N5_9PSEU|nr:ABC transporter permease [Actinokineospora xionganensis]MBC6447351.1 ABC transporter permease [Actinokineospora xionganensis]